MSTTYQSVLDRVAGYMGEADGLDGDDAALATLKLNFFVRLGWSAYWWPETMEVEARTFYPAYNSATTYAAGDVVYFPATHTYYQALATMSNYPPAAVVGGQYQTNTAVWIEAQASYSGDDFDTTLNYVTGDIVRNPEDDLFYVRIPGLILSGAGDADVNTSWQVSGTQNGKPIYHNLVTSLPLLYGLIGADPVERWGIYSIAAGGLAYSAHEDVATPDLVSAWDLDLGSAPAPTFSTSTDDITNRAFWAPLTSFERRLDYEQTGETPIGDVRFLWDSNPQTHRTARRVGGGRGPDFRLRRDHLQVLGLANQVWVEFRRQPPVFTNLIREDTETYAAGLTRFDRATGDCWISLASIAAGESPTSAPTKWERVVFPNVLAEFAAQSAYAMLTNKEQEQPENFTVEMAAGYPLLLAELDKLERQQGQTRQLHVVTGRS